MAGPQRTTVESASTSRSSTALSTRSSNRRQSEETSNSGGSPPSVPGREPPEPPTLKLKLKARLKRLRTWLSRRTGRFIPFIGYHHVLMVLSVVVVIFLSLVLAGCTAAGGLQNLHIVSLTEVTSVPTAGDLMMNQSLPQILSDWVVEESLGASARIREVRVSYFSSCVFFVDEGKPQCGMKSAEIDGASDPLGLLEVAHHFRTKTVNPGLMIVCILLDLFCFYILYTFPGWEEEEEDSLGSGREVKPFPSLLKLRLSAMSSAACSLGLYIAAMWQHVGVAAFGATIESLRYDLISVETGTACAVLTWLGVGLSSIMSVGIVLAILSIQVLTEMVD